MSWIVAAFYRFTPLAGLPDLRVNLAALLAANRVCGTLLLAPEGFNGTLAGEGEAFESALDELDQRLGLRAGELKFSRAANKPFQRLKVRLKPEIITLRAPEADPSIRTGIPVAPRDWDALIADPDVLLLDTRNAYEVAAGTFKGAVDPGLDNFTGFKSFAATLDPARHKKIAMYCTGGIRCEKASAYLLAHGFDTVYQLKGGILKYLEDVPETDRSWRGACFVFDERGALGPGLREESRP